MTSYLPPGSSRWPQYLPYPHALRMPGGAVPLAANVRFPAAQLTPAYAPAGSSSTIPFNYNQRMKVLYGSGDPYKTKSPRGVYGGAGCGCGGSSYGELPVDDDEFRAHTWRTLGLGLAFGAFLTHIYHVSKGEIIDD